MWVYTFAKFENDVKIFRLAHFVQMMDTDCRHKLHAYVIFYYFIEARFLSVL